MAALFLGGRRKDRLGQLLAFLQSFGQRDAAYSSIAAILLPSRTGQVAADHAFDGYDLSLADQHGAAREDIRLGPESLRQVAHLRAEEMIGPAEALEPEDRQRGQYAPLVRDAGRQHPVKGPNPVGGNSDAPLAKVVDVAQLAVPHGVAGDLTLQE